MSDIYDMLTMTATIKDMQQVGSSRLDQLVTVASSVPCLLYPESEESQLQAEGTYGRNYVFVCKSGVAIETNHVVVVDSIDYIVKGIGEHLDIDDGSENLIVAKVSRKNTKDA